MNKKKIAIIISSSILIAIVLILAILFGAVFRVRQQVVVFSNDYDWLASSESRIVTASGLKNGTSIFGVDKEKITQNIEATYPYVRVTQIRIKNATTIEYRINRRFETFYVADSGKFYVLDEYLKVLDILPNENRSDEPTNLIKINSTELGITGNTQVCDFIGNDFYQNVIKNTYISMCKTVYKMDEEGNVVMDEHNYPIYLERADVCNLITDISFGIDHTLSSTYERLILTTKYGVKIDIGKPQTDLQDKINACFATIPVLEKDKYANTTIYKGTIQYNYDKDANPHIVYIAETGEEVDPAN